MTIARLKSLIERHCAGVDLDRDLAGQIDSIQIATLLNAIEQEFNIVFPTAELLLLEPFSVDRLAATIERLMASHGKSPT